MATWTKAQTYLFIDTSATATPDWARIGKSTTFTLSLNAQTETQDYIEDENPTTSIKNYQPTLPQELRTIEGDDAFDFIFGMFLDRPTGTDAEKTILIVFPKTSTTSTYVAWKVGSTVTLKDFDTVAQKVTFDLSLNGTITEGTVTFADGVPTFVADAG